MNTKKYMVAAVVLTSIITTLILFFALYHKEADPVFTGGSGIAEPGHLILTGYEELSNDGSKIPLGKFLSIGQQAKIRSFLSALLFEKEPRGEYKGAVMPGSVDVNYKTSIVTFKVEVKKPKVTYIVNYNTINDEMSVTDEKGQPLRPTRNPDGTPFQST